MILIDMNQVCISNLMIYLNSIGKNQPIDEGLVRHMILTSLKGYKSKFNDYGEPVLCYDSKHYWRRQKFSFYKGTRKKDREKSEYDWTNIFDILNKLKREFKTSLPYKVVEVDGAEADDIISVLCKQQAMLNIKLQKENCSPEKVLILSGDKDFIQLQKYPFVKQYNPVQKKYVSGIDPKVYIKEHVLKGDRSDGIPNFLSSDDTFVTGSRQKPLTKKNLERWVNMSPEQFCSTPEQQKNYTRNLHLIDFTYIPVEVEENIINEYDNVKAASRSVLYDYFIKSKLIVLLDSIGEF
jgi:5'-3' exonuclease